MTEKKRGRGRPRQYDEGAALEAATDLFRTHGFAACSLERLSQATEMARPSLQAAFGSKSELFERTLDRFEARMAEAAEQALSAPRLDTALHGFFDAALRVYAPADGPALGCLVFGVATVDAPETPSVRARVRAALETVEGRLEERITRAVEAGELAETTDAPLLAQLLVSVLHSLSVRARAGDSTAQLRRLAFEGPRLLIAGAAAR